MKKLFTLCLAIALFNVTLAQAPQKFAYQGVARNNTGAPIINQLISIRASILHATSTGTAQYVETQSVTTNTLGLFTIQIGNGTVQSGTFSAITWANGSKFMKVEFDPAGGTSYVLSGTQQILSVPYALTAGNVINYVGGTGVSVSGSTITNTAPNQIVTLVPSGATSITGTYPTYTINTPNPTNYAAGNGISITGSTITNTAPNQTVSITGVAHTTVTGAYPNYTVNTPAYTASTGIAIVGNTVTNTAPNQTISLVSTGSTSVTGSYPNFVITSAKTVSGTSRGGFTPLILSGSGFTVTYFANGIYDVTFASPFLTMPTIVADVYYNSLSDGADGNNYFTKVYNVSTSGFRIGTLIGTIGNIGNVGFSFIATGN